VIPGGVAVAPDGQLVVSSAWKVGQGGAAVFGALIMAASGDAPGRFVELGKATPGKQSLPAALGEAAIQP
jgi:hypothetical protein